MTCQGGHVDARYLHSNKPHVPHVRRPRPRIRPPTTMINRHLSLWARRPKQCVAKAANPSTIHTEGRWRYAKRTTASLTEAACKGGGATKLDTPEVSDLELVIDTLHRKCPLCITSGRPILTACAHRKPRARSPKSNDTPGRTHRPTSSHQPSSAKRRHRRDE